MVMMMMMMMMMISLEPDRSAGNEIREAAASEAQAAPIRRL